MAKKKATQKSYMVIGLYSDNGQLFAQEFRASSPAAAESKALKYASIEVAAVMLGCKVVR